MSVVEQYPREAADPDCLDQAEGVSLLRDVPWRRMVVVGDSLAAGVTEPVEGYRNEGFCNRVGAALVAAHDGAAYVNLGVRDLWLHQIREQQLDRALEFGPDLAVVIGGGNDALSRRYDRDRIRHELRELIVPLQDAGAFVVTIGLFDLARSGLVPEEYAPAMIERFDDLDEVTSSLARELGALHVDTHHHPRASDPAIFASDRMHANAVGHAVAFAAVVRALAEAA
jgi:lysophospholipase L1-like esterase